MSETLGGTSGNSSGVSTGNSGTADQSGSTLFQRNLQIAQNQQARRGETSESGGKNGESTGTGRSETGNGEPHVRGVNQRQENDQQGSGGGSGGNNFSFPQGRTNWVELDPAPREPNNLVEQRPGRQGETSGKSGRSGSGTSTGRSEQSNGQPFVRGVNQRRENDQQGGGSGTSSANYGFPAGRTNWVELDPKVQEPDNWVELRPEAQPGLTEEQMKEVRKARANISQRVLQNREAGAELNAEEKKLAEADPVSLAMIQELDVDLNSNRTDLSPSESTIAKEQPLVFGILQSNGVRVSKNELGVVVVEHNGQRIQLSDTQRQIAESGQVGLLARTLLNTIEPDEKTKTVIYGSGDVRTVYTTIEVGSLMKSGKDEDAMGVLKTNMDASLTSEQRQVIWATAGEPNFTTDYFRQELREQISDPALKKPGARKAADHAGQWLQRTAQAIPEEAASNALDAVKQEFKKEWVAGEYIPNLAGGMPFYDGTSGEALYKGISGLVEKSPERADEIASWMTNRESNGNALFDVLRIHDFEPVVKTGADGYGITLASEIRNDLNAIAEKMPKETNWLGFKSETREERLAQNFSEKFEEAYQQHARKSHSDFVASQYAAFIADTSKSVAPHFDNLKGIRGIEENVQFRSDTELRNIVGRSMGLTPDNEAAALAKDYSSDWYSASSDSRRQIDLVVGWMKKEGGDEFSFRAKPFIYASDKAGISNGALFEVTNSDGDRVVIDGSMADDVIAEHDGKPVNADTNTQLNYKYDSVKEFFDDNYLDPEGKMYMAQATGLTDNNNDGHVDVKTVAAANVTTWEAVSPWVMTGVGVVGFVGGVLLAIPSAGTSLGLSAAATATIGTVAATSSIAIGVGISGHDLYEMSDHGRDIWTLRNEEARGAWLNLAGAALSVGALGAGARSAQLLTGSRNAIAAQGLAATGRATIAAEQSARMALASAQWANRASVIGHGATGLGVVQMGDGVYQTAAHWEDMTFADAARSVFDIGLGMADFGIGVHSARRQPSVETQKDVNLRAAAQKVYDHILYEKAMNRESRPILNGTLDDPTADVTLFHPEDGSASLEVKVIRHPNGEIVLEPVNQPESGIEYKHVRIRTRPKKSVSPWRKLDDKIGDGLVASWPKLSGETLYAEYLTRVRKLHAEGKLENANFDPNMLPDNARAFRVDDKTRIHVRIPEGLRHMANDFHLHSMGYDRRTGNLMIAVAYHAGNNSRVLSGSIPQFCGDPHYLNFNPNMAIMDKAQALDLRAVENFHELLTTDVLKARLVSVDENEYYINLPGRMLAAKMDLSLTGFDFSNAGTQDVVAYGRKMMLENPGMFNAIGEITGKKENVSNLLGPNAWDMTSQKFRDYLSFANDTGQAVLLHYDWGTPGLDGAGRTQAIKTNYDNFDEIVATLGAVHPVTGERIYKDTNIVMAHTGIGRYVRPSDKLETRTVTVRDMKGKVKEIKEVTAPEHILKLYEFFDKVPNARADISWNDVAQAYADSPALREGIVQFVIDNQDRLLWGSDTVKPFTKAHYNQALNSSKRMMLDIALRDPEALWKLLKGNYETVMDNARHRIEKWTSNELKKELGARGGDLKTREMYRMNNALAYYRDRMVRGARRDFDLWVERVRSLNDSGLYDVKENSGVFPYLYESLSEAQLHEAGHGHHDQEPGGTGSSGGWRQQDPELRKKVTRDGAIVGTLSAGISLAGGLAGIPTEALNLANAGAFAARSTASAARAERVERFRQYTKDIFGREGQGLDFTIERDQLDRLVTLIHDSKEALGFSDEQILRSLAATEQFWVNYQDMINTKKNPISHQRGLTEWQRYHDVIALVGEYQITLARELGGDVAFIDPMDARNARGMRHNARWVLPTLLVNEMASVAWVKEAFADGMPDITTAAGAAEASTKLLFFAGNSVLAGRTIALIAGGKHKVSLVNAEVMKKFRQVEAALFASAGAAWTTQDIINGVNQMMDVSSLDEGLAKGSLALTKVVLDAAFATAEGQVFLDETKRLNGGDMRSPHALYTTRKILLGALALRCLILAGEVGAEWWKEVDIVEVEEEEDQQIRLASDDEVKQP